VLPVPRPVTLRSVTLGDGTPAVCVPLVAATADALAGRAAELADAAGPWRDAVDVVELRLDHLTAVDDLDRVVEAVGVVRAALPDEVPVIATFRTKQEGGERDITPDAYGRLLERLIGLDAATRPDAVDVEMYTQPDVLERVVDAAHAAGVVVLMSSHDFTATPDRAEIVSRLVEQQEHGADVVKLAAMPREPADVLTLLAATEEFRRGPGLVPAVTMSMGALGAVSRLAGETVGSAMTFGAAGEASAPGQVDARALRAALRALGGTLG